MTGDRVVVQPPIEELDPDTVPAFDAWIRGVLSEVLPPPPAVVVLDFTALKFLSAGGITALLELERRLDGYALRLAGVQGAVERVLLLCEQERLLIDRPTSNGPNEEE